MDQLLIETMELATRRFKNNKIRVWYIKVGPKNWRAIIFNTQNRIVYLRGPAKKSPKSALNAIGALLITAMQKIS
jgi:hypothetical protein